MRKPTEYELAKLKGIANYQFGKGTGDRLFPTEILIKTSRRTNKIRYIYFEGKLLATLIPTSGLLALSIEGAKRFMKHRLSRNYEVVVQDDITPFIMKGGNVFSRHIIAANPKLRPKEEVLIVNKNRELLAVGRAMIGGEEMLSSKKGVAVKVRKGVEKD